MQQDFAQLHRQVMFHESNGKIIWQPRILCWYSDKKFAGESLPEPYTNMTLNEIYRSLGCSSRLYSEFSPCFRRREDQRVQGVTKQLNETDTEITIETPVGKQVTCHRRSPNNPHPIMLKWPVTDEAELRVAIWREQHATWEWDQGHYDRMVAEVGDLGAPTVYFPRMNVQDLYINLMGVEQATYALMDWTDTVEAYFEALETNHAQLLDLACASPIEIFNFGENVHGGTLPPPLFEKYHLPACQRRCDRLHEAGKSVNSHWDGDTRPLLPYAQATRLDGIEAITPVPQGDVTLEEMKAALGDTMILLDGIPAVYFDETFSVSVLADCVHQLIELFAPNLVLGISDEISSTGDIERIRIVGKIVDRYNQSVEANQKT